MEGVLGVTGETYEATQIVASWCSHAEHRNKRSLYGRLDAYPMTLGRLEAYAMTLDRDTRQAESLPYGVSSGARRRMGSAIPFDR